MAFETQRRVNEQRDYERQQQHYDELVNRGFRPRNGDDGDRRQLGKFEDQVQELRDQMSHMHRQMNEMQRAVEELMRSSKAAANAGY